MNDRWTLDLRELGYDREAEILAHMLLLAEPPFVTALTGPGGSGKTSVLRYVMTLLGGSVTRVQLPHRGVELHDDNHGGNEQIAAIQQRGRELLTQHNAVGLADAADKNPLSRRTHHRVATAWFNPWRFRNEPNPVAPLLRGLREQLTLWGRNANWTATHARAHFEAGLQLLGQLQESTAGGETTPVPAVRPLDAGAMRVAGALDRAQIGHIEQLSDAERFRLLFEHALESILGVVDARSKRKGKPNAEFATAENHRLVVFIDDLDRCDGDTIERVLEAVELYLDTRYSVFVFATDLSTLTPRLSAHWGACHPMAAEDYLDRSFQNRMQLSNSERFPLFIHNRLSAWGLVDTKPLAIDADTTDAHAVARLIADISPKSPRRLKALLNGLRLSWEVAKARLPDLTEAELSTFALVHRLRTSAPRVLELLESDTDYHLRVLQDFFEHCQHRTPYRPDPAHAAAGAVLVDAFRSMVNLDADWRTAAVPVAAPAPSPRVDRLLADRAFSRHWRDAGITSAAVRRYAGLVGDR